MLNRKSLLNKIISSILIMVISVNTSSSVVFAADVILENAQLGEAFGNSMKDSVLMPTEAGGVLTLPSSGQGNAVQININDLYPATSSTNERDASYYFPGGQMPSVDAMIEVGDSDSSLNNEGTNANKYLGSDALLENPSLAGSAYQIVLDQARTPSRDFNNDPMFRQTNEMLDNIDIIAKEFSDCKTEESFFDSSFTAHTPSYETCERITKPKGMCELKHEIVTNYKNFDVKVAAKGREVLTVKFDLKNGSYQTIAPTDGDYFNAEIPIINYDEMCKDYKASEARHIGTWDWTGSGIPGSFDSTVTYKVLQPPLCENNLEGIVQITDRQSGSDPEYVLAGRYTFTIISLLDELWSPESCYQAYKLSNSEFCSGGAIRNSVDNTNDMGCIEIYDTSICPNGNIHNALSDPIVPGYSKFVDSIYIGPVSCNFNVGNMDCYTDANGITQCPYNEGSITNSCSNLENNPKCAFVKTECVNGAKDSNGTCLVYEDIYDCGYSAQIPTYTSETKYTCAGPIRCMGSECVSPDKSNSQDFARVSALLQAAQTMGQDLSCTTSATEEGGDSNIDVGCTVFAGEGAECKKAVGGIVNCCEKPDGISLSDYVSLVMAVPKLDTAIMSIGKDSSFKIIKSGYEALREPIVGAFQEISKPFTGLLDNVTGAIDSVKGAIDGVLDQLKEKMVDMFNQVFGNVAAETGAGAAGGVAAGPAAEQAGEQIVNNIGSALSVIGNIYTIYSVTMLAIKMIYKCTEKELELNVQRVLKNTHYIGSYCKSEFLGACIEKRETYCMFKSPLSRILQEQVRHQLALSWGTPEEPECQGLTIEQFAEVDWTMVNLDEWLAILGETGNLPDPATMSLQQLTGAGTTLDLGSRIEAETRTMEHFQDIDTEKIRRETSDSHQPYNNYIPAVP